MFKYILKKQLFIIPIFVGVLIFSCRVWNPSHLIVPLPSIGFIDVTELIVPYLISIPISFLLYNNYEIELALACGISTARITFTKFVTIVLYTLLPYYAMAILYQYLPFVADSRTRIVFPILIPENYKIYMMISVTVTVLFFSSLFLFLRVIMRNCYTPIIIGLAAHLYFCSLNESIHKGMIDVRKALYDPFLSNYFLGDEVPNMYKLDGMHNLWTYNRLLFTGIAVVLLILTYLLLRREKLHESFGE